MYETCSGYHGVSNLKLKSVETTLVPSFPLRGKRVADIDLKSSPGFIELSIGTRRPAGDRHE